MSQDEIRELLYQYYPTLANGYCLELSTERFKEVFKSSLAEPRNKEFFSKILYSDRYGELGILDCALLLNQIDIVKELLSEPQAQLKKSTLWRLLDCENDYSDEIINAIQAYNYNFDTCLSELQLEYGQSKLPSKSTFIHHLAYKNNLFVLSKLTKGTVNVDKQNSHGETALHVAIKADHWQVAKTLIALGASLDIKDNQKNCARDILDHHAKLSTIIQTINKKYSGSSGQDFDEAVTEFFKETNITDFLHLFPKKINNHENERTFQPCRITMLQDAFWSLQATNYLRRNEFTTHRTKLTECSPKEFELYQALTESNIAAIPFRLHENKNNFYDQEFYQHGSYLKTIDTNLNVLYDTFSGLQQPSPLYVDKPSDLYQGIRQVIHCAKNGELNADNQGFAYILSAMPKDEHIYTMLSIIDTQQKKPVGHFFINSWNSEKYYDYTAVRQSLAYEDAKTKAAPLFNLSFQLQSDKQDYNCAIYTLENIQQMVKMWQTNPVLFQNLAQHAKNMESSNKVKPDELYLYQAPALDTFVLELKKRLPHFFDNTANLQVRGNDALRHYFLKMRWLIGNSAIFNHRKRAISRLNLIQQTFTQTPDQKLDGIDPLRAYLNGEIDLNSINYLDTYLSNKEQSHSLLSHLKWPVLITGALTLATWFAGLISLSALILVGSVMGQWIRERFKSWSVNEYIQKDICELDSLSREQITAFEVGVHSAISSKAQLLSCFNRAVIFHPKAFYAGLGTQEKGTEEALINDIRSRNRAKNQ